MNRETYRNLMETIDQIRSNEQQLNERPTQGREFYVDVATKLVDKHLNDDLGEWKPSDGLDFPKLKIPKLNTVLKLPLEPNCARCIGCNCGNYDQFRKDMILSIASSMQSGVNPEPQVKQWIEAYKTEIYETLYKKWEYERSTRAQKVLKNMKGAVGKLGRLYVQILDRSGGAGGYLGGSDS